jgi:hypothetical protein
LTHAKLQHGVRSATFIATALLLGFASAAVNAAEQHRCMCRANGQSYQQGQVLCIFNKLQRCEMLLNNSSWKVIADICPQASLAPGLAKIVHLPDHLPRSELPRC